MNISVIVVGGTPNDVIEAINFGKARLRGNSADNFVFSTEYRGSTIVGQRLSASHGRLKIYPNIIFDWLLIGGDPATGYPNMVSQIYGITPLGQSYDLIFNVPHINPAFPPDTLGNQPSTARLPYRDLVTLPNGDIFTSTSFYKSVPGLTPTSTFAPIIDNAQNIQYSTINERRKSTRVLLTGNQTYQFLTDPIYGGRGPIQPNIGNNFPFLPVDAGSDTLIQAVGDNVDNINRVLFTTKGIFEDTITSEFQFRSALGVIAIDGSRLSFPTMPVALQRSLFIGRPLVIDNDNWFILASSYDSTFLTSPLPLAPFSDPEIAAMAGQFEFIRSTDGGLSFTSGVVPPAIANILQTSGTFPYKGWTNQSVNVFRISELNADKIVIGIFTPTVPSDPLNGRFFISDDVGLTWTQAPAIHSHVSAGASFALQAGQLINLNAGRMAVTASGLDLFFTTGRIPEDRTTYIYKTDDEFQTYDFVGQHPAGNISARYRTLFYRLERNAVVAYTMVNNTGFTPFASPAMYRSEDLGATWTQTSELPQLRFPRLVPLRRTRQSMDSFFPLRFL